MNILMFPPHDDYGSRAAVSIGMTLARPPAARSQYSRSRAFVLAWQAEGVVS